VLQKIEHFCGSVLLDDQGHSPHLGMAMGTRDPVGFSPIRRRVWVGFYIHGSVGGTDFVPSGFAGLGVFLLNPDTIPVVPRLKLNKHACSSSLQQQFVAA
jgi:hypothetical protein